MAQEDDDNLITIEQSPEELAAEEGAFATAFTETRGESELSEEADGQGAGTEEVVPGVAAEGDPAPVAADANTDSTATPVTTERPVPPKLIAGLTEEQLVAALNRNATLQGAVDKMAGRIGNLMQQIETLRTNPPTTKAAQAQLNLKLEKLGAQFPELANLLREDLQGLDQQLQVDPAPAAPLGMTQEQVDAIVAQRLLASKEEMKEAFEVKVLTMQHPDWNEVIRTPEFALFRDNVLPQGVGAQLMSSEDSIFISGKLTEFKEWRKARQNPTPAPAPVVPAAVIQRKSRLSNAVLPAGGGQPAQTAVTEEDAFAAGFKSERSKRGF